MRELRRLVHSPHHLFVFEVCARLLSFTRAAEELGVSQPAVSLAIRQLEDAIGQDLFERRHRAMLRREVAQPVLTEILLSVPADLPFVHCDAVRIERALVELLRQSYP